MIVENDIVIALDLEQRVEAFGYHVCGIVSRGHSAVEAAAAERPDLVLMDILLNGEVDGIEAAQRIRTQLGIPVVFVASYADDERLKRAKLTMPFGYIVKPFRDRDLRITLEMALYVARGDARRKKTEEEVVKIKEEWERTFDTVSDIILIVDKEHNIIRLNRAAARVLDVTPEEALDRKCYELMHRQAAPPDFCLHSNVLREKKEYRTMFEAPHFDLDFSLTISPWFDERGRAVGSVHVLRDITELMGSKAALQESEAKLSSIFRASPTGIGLVAEEVLLWVNDRICDMTGYASEELIGRNIRMLYPDDEVFEWFEQGENGRIVRNEIISLETRWQHKNGLILHVLLSATPLDLRNPAKGVTFTSLNITERKQAERELNASRDTLMTVLENFQANIHVADMNTHEILFVNRHLTESFGRDLVGERCHEVFRGRKTPCDYCTNNRLLDSENRPAGVIIWDDRNPITGRWYMNYDQAIQWMDGRYVRLQAAMDVTDIKKGEQEREKLESRLRQSQKMEAMGSLAGGIAHDFNNILGAIVGYTELGMLDLESSSQAHKNLKQALNAASRAKKLVEQILTFSRQTEQQFNPVDVALIIDEALRFLRSSLPSTIEIRLNMQKNAGAILADATEIHQIMMNLCTNAAHAMRKTGGMLEVKLAEVFLGRDALYRVQGLKSGRYIRIGVSDTGEGMDPEVLERIFEPYFTTKKQTEGTGLGLAVVHGIVKNSGGGIQVYSEKGKGTSVFLFFPVAGPVGIRESPPLQQIPRGSELIILVDDEKDIIDVGRQMLDRLGYAVESYTDSREALNAFKRRPGEYDLVVTDQTMPHLTGSDLAREMMKIRPNIPIILCTGFSESITADQAEKMGIRAFLMKPLIIRKLASTIRRILDDK